MENRGLLFIPDISGFTRFVNESEIGHSRLIIQELLETLINSNEIGLEISEIEGDAILFYKYGESPELAELYKQVEKMFCEFHRNLNAYEYGRLCQCKACTSAINLSLKVITHYGEFTGYQVKDFKKLIGKDIIVAHQLLKNDIDQHEYWLITPPLAGNKTPGNLTKWMEWNKSEKITEQGDVPFFYTQLSQLKNEIPPASQPELGLAEKTKMFSLSKDYPTDMVTLFHAAGDFSYRSNWQEGVSKVEEIHHLLPRVGMGCRVTNEKGQQLIYNSSYAYQPGRIEFTETDEKKKHSVHYILEEIDKDNTRLTLEYYLAKNFLNETIFNLAEKKKMIASYERSLERLGELAKGLDFRVDEEDVES